MNIIKTNPISTTLFMLALIFSITASLSLQRNREFQGMYIARTHLDGAVVQHSEGVSRIRFGIWGYCYYNWKDELMDCLKTNHVTITQKKDVAVVDWALAQYVLISQLTASVVSLVVFIYSLIDNNNNFVYYIAYILAAVAQLLAAIFNVKFYLDVKSKLLKFGATDSPGAGFALTFVSFGLILLSGVILFRYRLRNGPCNTKTKGPSNTIDHGEKGADGREREVIHGEGF